MIVLTLCPGLRSQPAVRTLLKLLVESSQHPPLIIKITIGSITIVFSFFMLLPFSFFVPRASFSFFNVIL